MLSNNKYVINYVNIIKMIIRIDIKAVSQPVKTIQWWTIWYYIKVTTILICWSPFWLIMIQTEFDMKWTNWIWMCNKITQW